jgi:hypothetical protein
MDMILLSISILICASRVALAGVYDVEFWASAPCRICLLL